MPSMERPILVARGVMLLAAALSAPALSAQAVGADARSPIAPFTLRDCFGNAHQVGGEDEKSVVVVLFTGTECPLAQLYAPVFTEISRKRASSAVRFLSVAPHRQDSITRLQQFVRDNQWNIPLLVDHGQVIADQFGVERTPEVFVLNRRLDVLYRGRIDDQFGVGYQRPAPRRRYLVDALEAALKGRSPDVARTDSVGCRIARRRATDGLSATRDGVSVTRDGASAAGAGAITWSKDVAVLLQRHCQDCHHADGPAPFSLVGFDEAAGWADAIAEAVGEQRMPPWHASSQYGHFSNAPTITDAERDKLIGWSKQGALPGDLTTAPAERQFPRGWRLKHVDQTVAIPPFKVPTAGPIEYQWITVDPGFAEDKWIEGTEVRPTARSAVHHATVYVRPPGSAWDLRANSKINLLGGYNPGGDPWNAPKGMAMKVPARSKLVFEMHYTPTGVEQIDQTVIALDFAESTAVKQQVVCVMPANDRLRIPPRSKDLPWVAEFALPADCLLLSLRPHMHLRGAAFRYDALYPGGRRERLLEIPRYDFSWQRSYVLANPIRLPEGTILWCEGRFDNSEDNPNNPDPSATVIWGDQSSDEMLIGIATLARADQDLTQTSRDGSPQSPPFSLGLTLLVGALSLSILLVLPRRRRFENASNTSS